MKEEEKNIDIKETISKLIKEEEPEMTQEEAIMKYKENKNGTDDDNAEEAEHLNRIKRELLASLERVKQFAKKLYGEDKNNTKVNKKDSAQKNKVKEDKNKEQQEDKINNIENGRERE